MSHTAVVLVTSGMSTGSLSGAPSVILCWGESSVVFVVNVVSGSAANVVCLAFPTTSAAVTTLPIWTSAGILTGIIVVTAFSITVVVFPTVWSAEILTCDSDVGSTEVVCVTGVMFR